MTIYYQLMSPEAYKAGTVPSAGSLYEEAQALMFAGADTTGNTPILGTFYLLKTPEMYQTLKAELQSAWPHFTEQPPLSGIEQLPSPNSVIKEALRMSSGVVSGLLRVVPKGCATIADHYVPAGVIVSCGSTFVHYNFKTFPSPHEFQSERWLENPSLHQWLVALPEGPRSCLAINLACLELRLGFAHFFRRFEMALKHRIQASSR
jgi:cytochrome P450